MFSVSFRRCRHRRPLRRNNFCFSRQNRFSLTLDIWGKQSVGPDKNVLDDLSVTLSQEHGCGNA